MRMTYTERPKQRAARDAWDYFMSVHPAKTRSIELFYSPNISGYGPGWIWQLGHLEEDTLHWKGGDSLIFDALSSNIRAAAIRSRAAAGKDVGDG